MAFENILVDTRGAVGLITLNRPQALNALNGALIQDLGEALDGFEDDDAIGCIVQPSAKPLRRVTSLSLRMPPPPTKKILIATVLASRSITEPFPLIVRSPLMKGRPVGPKMELSATNRA